MLYVCIGGQERDGAEVGDGPGGQLGLKHARCVCREVKVMGSFFGLK